MGGRFATSPRKITAAHENGGISDAHLAGLSLPCRFWEGRKSNNESAEAKRSFTMASMNCPNCAMQISEKGAFCPGCGYTLSLSPPVASAVEVNQILSGYVFDFGIWKLLKYEISGSGWTRLGEEGFYTGSDGGRYGVPMIRRINKTKGQIIKIWLWGGTLGFHYFAILPSGGF